MMNLVLISALFFSRLCSAIINIDGRVMETNNYGIQGSIVKARSGNTEITVRANQLGYYRMRVPNCGEYEFSAYSKTHIFSSQTFIFPIPDVGDDLTINFIAID